MRQLRTSASPQGVTMQLCRERPVHCRNTNKDQVYTILSEADNFLSLLRLSQYVPRTAATLSNKYLICYVAPQKEGSRQTGNLLDTLPGWKLL